jgi:hypothetical protein
MTLVIDLPPEVESRLQEEAARQGIPVPEYVRGLLENLVKRQDTQGVPGHRSLLEFEGLGAEIWKGIDAQEYVNELRKEWDHRCSSWRWL